MPWIPLMNFLSFIPIISTVIDRIFPDKEKQDQAKIELTKVLTEAEARKQEAEANKLSSQKDVIVAEASGQSPAQRNWRPHLMYLFMALIAMNYLLVPTLAIFGVIIHPYPLPEQIWTLLKICLGGYIVGRSGEKIASSFNDTKFFSQIRQDHNISQKEVDILNKALAQGKADD